MAPRVVGAGVGRTGTHSLKLALERLLGAPCYHMLEVFGHPDHIPLWHAAAEGRMPDWDALMSGYAAAVDWPAAAFWPELAAAFPDAVILLSVRDTDSWWTSANHTIFEVARSTPPPDPVATAQLSMVTDLLRTRFSPDWSEERAAKVAYERHNAEVRATAPADRLLEWHPGDGWEPICAALGVAVPDEPFPHVNTSEEFRRMVGLDAS